MKKILIILIVLLNNLNIWAQTDSIIESKTRIGLTDSDLQKAIDLYIKMMQTETYKANRIATNKIIAKLDQKVIPKEIMNDIEWEKWITRNIKKTKFINATEANKLRNLNIALTKKQFDENIELYEMIKKATVEQGLEILKPERAIRPF
jgi:hypothetical protein